jgi:CubicO group peptidase (beta-lactamase class C family)
MASDIAAALPTEVGLSANRLSRLLDDVAASRYDLHSLLIVRDGKLALESYRHDIDRSYNHSLYSVTKSVVATMLGTLLMQRRITSIDAPIAALMPKPWTVRMSDWDKTKRITLRNVMQMSSGLDRKYETTNDPIYGVDADRLALALAPPFIADPGTRFNYSNADATIAGAAIAAAGHTTLLRLAIATLFKPLEMTNYDWPAVDAAGRYPAGWAMRLRPMDMAKIGQLYLQGGVWNYIRVFDTSFLNLCWAPGTVPYYGLYWWIGSDSGARGYPYFYANGWKGQRIFVFPALRLVAVYTGCLTDNEGDAADALVIRALVEATAPSNEADSAAQVLVDKQKAGFNGITRMSVEDQDTLTPP